MDKRWARRVEELERKLRRAISPDERQEISDKLSRIFDRFERKLRNAKTSEGRRTLFEELARLYAKTHLAVAIKWAAGRQSLNPVDDGQGAYSRAFILLVKSLHKLDFKKQTLNYYFKGRIWSELGHERTRRNKRAERSDPLNDDETNLPTIDGQEAHDRLATKQSLRRILPYVDTPSKKRILRAGILKAEGYSWDEVARVVRWEGSTESLRVSYSKLLRELRERNGQAAVHSHP